MWLSGDIAYNSFELMSKVVAKMEAGEIDRLIQEDLYIPCIKNSRIGTRKIG